MAEETSQETTEQAESEGFKAITSQEQLNRTIGERINAVKSQFSDYDDLKAKAARLDEIEEANKSEIEKARERVEQAEAVAGQVPAKVTEALRDHLVKIHDISDDDAELFLTATDPATLLKQIDRLVARSEPKARTPRPNPAQSGGETTPKGDWLREQLART